MNWGGSTPDVVWRAGLCWGRCRRGGGWFAAVWLVWFRALDPDQARDRLRRTGGSMAECHRRDSARSGGVGGRAASNSRLMLKLLATPQARAMRSLGSQHEPRSAIVAWPLQPGTLKQPYLQRRESETRDHLLRNNAPLSQLGIDELADRPQHRAHAQGAARPLLQCAQKEFWIAELCC